MSYADGPPSKVVKLGSSPSYEAVDGEDGQEEWLSEGLLTDDDCDATADINTSCESRRSQQSDEHANDTEDSKANIEDKLNSLENSQNEPELHAVKVKYQSDDDYKHSEDDGNDTDDLLRMLGDEGNKKKKKVIKMVKKKVKGESSGEDDEFDYIFENAKKASQLKMAKNVLIKNIPAKKAVPEDSDTDMTSDDANVVKKMFGVKKVNVAAKSTAKSALAFSSPKVISPPGKLGGAIATRSKKPELGIKLVPRTPMVKSIPQKHSEANRVSQSSRTAKIMSAKPQPVQSKPTPKPKQETVREEKILKEDQHVNKSKGPVTENEESKKSQQLIMNPERMEEEMLSDDESESEIGSICDEMPSSESDDTEDWFTLDIRAERAGEYLPLLGPVAHQLLLEEKARVSTKLEQVRESLTEVTEKSRIQANLLKNASTTLTQIEAIISAT